MSINFDNVNVYERLLRVCKLFAVHPLSSIESEEFFRLLVAQYVKQGDLDDFEEWVSEQLLVYFKYVKHKPRWLQDPEWPFSNGLPMIFVGQFDIDPLELPNSTSLFHDATSIYVFIGNKSLPVAIMQQY
ncbi:MAG: hypothetical protein H6668_04395 [Ardenticatenaceae bacterium]|nr:hypothetical protein [Ardenticatenaceae bacterium]